MNMKTIAFSLMWILIVIDLVIPGSAGVPFYLHLPVHLLNPPM
jgi:hypothetical protein